MGIFDPPEENQFNTKGNNCEYCQFYILVDSGYGYCRRFPPKMRKEKWWKKKWVIEYPLTEWCRRACGEFKFRHSNEKK